MHVAYALFVTGRGACNWFLETLEQVINSNVTHNKSVSIELETIFGLVGTVKVRDVWAHTDNGTASSSFSGVVGPADSLFVTLTPA
jgi:hypothetical protein